MLQEFLEKYGVHIYSRWRELVLETYPGRAAETFKREKDGIANPVGSNISEALQKIFDRLVDKSDDFEEPLEEIIKIRAIQNFTASGAVGFVFLLKQAIREELIKRKQDPAIVTELLEFEPRIDRMSLLAFDLYMRRREMVYDMKAGEIRKRSRLILERANLELNLSCSGQVPENGGQDGRGDDER